MGWPQKSFKVVIILFGRPKKIWITLLHPGKLTCPENRDYFNKISTSSSHWFVRFPGWLGVAIQKWKMYQVYHWGYPTKKVVIWGPPPLFWKSIPNGNSKWCILPCKTYLEPKWPLFWLEKALVLGGLTFKNTGLLQFPGIYLWRLRF